MEEIQESKRKSYLSRRLIVLLLVFVLVSGLYAVVKMGGGSLLGMRRLVSDVPLVRLKIKVAHSGGVVLPVGESRLGSIDTTSPTPIPTAETSSPSTPTPQYFWGPSPTPTEVAERELAYKLVRAPFALSVSIHSGDALYAWLEKNEDAKAFFASELFQGALIDVSNVLNIRGEDLKLEGFKGAVLSQILREPLSAEFSLHYDVTRGRSGYVAEFLAAKAPTVKKLLPLLVASTARREYRVDQIDTSIIELLLGSERIYLAEEGGKILIGTGLSGLLNLLEQSPLPAAGSGAVTITARGEAFFKNLLPVVTGSSTWHVSWDLPLGEGAGMPGTLYLPAAKTFSYLKPKLEEGVIASIPADAFSAAAASLYLPPEMTSEEWNRIALKGLTDQPITVPSAGAALVWDLVSGEGGALSNIGFAISRPQGSTSKLQLKDYFDSSIATSECAGGTVWLAASTEALLARMKEGCERQSRSLLDTIDRSLLEKNLLLLINPRRGGVELVSAGFGEEEDESSEEEEDPEWRKRYDAAIARARESAVNTFVRLPSILFAGKISSDGGILDGVVLKGEK